LFVFSTILVIGGFNFFRTAAYSSFISHGDNTCCIYKISPMGRNLIPKSEINSQVVNRMRLFNQIQNCYCLPPISDPEHFTVEIDRSGNNITIREIFNSSYFSYSYCDYRITGEIIILPTGFYYLSFIFENRVFNETEILGIFYIDLRFL
jgi:hypothetical protein